MIDVSNSIRDSFKHAFAWTERSFRAAFAAIQASRPDQTIEPESPDEALRSQCEWTVFRHGRKTIFLHRALPLVMCHNSTPEPTLNEWRALGLRVLVYEDKSTASWSCEDVVLRTLCGLGDDESWDDLEFWPDAFSIDDLYYFSNTLPCHYPWRKN